MNVQVRILFAPATEKHWQAMHSIALDLTNEPDGVRVFAETNPNWLVAEFTIPTEAQYKAVDKIEQAVRFHADDRDDSTFSFPFTARPMRPRRPPRCKTEGPPKRNLTGCRMDLEFGGSEVLTSANIESELSYAYLHAVASRAGFACEWRNRHLDGAGVDATVTEDGRRLAIDSKLTYIPVDVQLKATYAELPEANGKLSFSLDIKQYDKLRSESLGSPRLLVVLRLPRAQEEWLQVTTDGLLAKRCAHWVSLRGAPAVTDQDSRTIYVPVANVLSPDQLIQLMTRFSRQEVIPYAG